MSLYDVEGFSDRIKEKYGSPEDNLEEMFKESFELKGKTFRVVKFPSLDELTNAFMSGEQVEFVYAQVSSAPMKVYKPGTVSSYSVPQPNVAVDETGRRSYLLEFSEKFVQIKGYVEGVSSNLWNKKRDALLQWDAVIGKVSYGGSDYYETSSDVWYRLKFNGERCIMLFGRE